MLPEILGQTLGIIATLITALSYQANTKKKLLFIQSVATLCTCISYLLLGATSGFALNIVCLIRNVCFYFQKEGKTLFYISTSIFVVMMGILGAMSWQGPISLLIIVALAANTFFLSLGKPQMLRYSILVTSLMVLIYNIYVLAIGGILNESIAILSAFIGIIRFRKKSL
jgi:hypothetical protein